mmetsp:Transcript_110104/g.329164  ORF Transcript_110104/g.329164 Transcript_110104/m.329164 type:complete len:206 (-) Transcript_110104:71-688(-)
MLVHVGVLEAEARLLRWHPGAHVELLHGNGLPRALRAILGLLASVRCQAVKLLRRRTSYRRVGNCRHSAKCRVQLLLHLHPDMHVADLGLFVCQQSRPFPGPPLPQRHAELPDGSGAPAGGGGEDEVEEAQGQRVPVLVVGMLSKAGEVEHVLRHVDSWVGHLQRTGSVPSNGVLDRQEDTRVVLCPLERRRHLLSLPILWIQST